MTHKTATKWMAALLICCLPLLGYMNSVSAQEQMPVKRVSKKVPGPALFAAKLFLRIDKEGKAIKGPFDIIVANTDKAQGPFKYSDVPYFIILSGDIIAFPSGDWGKNGEAIAVITSNYTIRTK